MHHGFLTWGNRVIVPTKLRGRVIETRHGGHTRTVKMKGLAKGYVWWPRMNEDLEGVTKRCEGCQGVANNPKQAPLLKWEYPAYPWQRLHIDFAGPFQGKMFLVVVDERTKWPDIFEMRNTTATETVATLRSLFARMGLPKQVVSDNGPQFVSGEFKHFTEMNVIQHVTGAPYHPSTNGLAERMVHSFKNAVKADRSDRSIQHKLDRFLSAYRTAPHATTGHSPAQLLFGRNLKSRLDFLKPNIKRVVDGRHLKNEKGTLVSFQNGEKVMVRYYNRGPKWLKGEVLERIGPVLYKVLVDGATWRCHVDQMRRSEYIEYRNYDYLSTQAPSETAGPLSDPSEAAVPPVTSEQAELTEEHGRDVSPVTDDRVVTSGVKTTRSGRVSRVPVTLKDYVY